MNRVEKIVAGLILLFAFVSLAAHAATPLNDARATVRLLSSAVSPFKCSAVVIAPEVALTAKHCVDIPALLVDALPATVSRTHPLEDVAELSVPGLACPCAKISPNRPALDEALIVVGYLYGELLVVSHGEYLGAVTDPAGLHYGIIMAAVGPGMSGGGVFRVFVTGEIYLVGIQSAMAPLGIPGLYVEVSRDMNLWN